MPILLATAEEIIKFKCSFQYDIEIDDSEYYPKKKWITYGALIDACLELYENPVLLNYHDFKSFVENTLIECKEREHYLAHIGNNIILKRREEEHVEKRKN